MAQNFFPTAAQLITDALRALAAVDPESTTAPSTTESTNALRALNYIVNSWSALGLQGWCHKTVSYTLSAANSYTIGPSGATITAARPLKIIQAWLRDTSTDAVDIPINIISRDEYNMLSVKTSDGPPTSLFYDPEYDRDATNSGANAKGKIYVWPQPTSTEVTNYDLYMVVQRPLQDFSATTDTLDFPQEWFNAIKWNLAYQLSFEYGTVVEKQDRIRKLAEETLELAKSWDVDQTPVFFQPENRY